MSDAAVVIRAEKLRWRAGGRDILRGVDLELREGEILGVIGPNGAGKSTLMKLLARVARPHAGRLCFEGRAYDELPHREFARRLGYLEQNAQVHWPLRAAKVVELGRLPWREGLRGLSAADREAIARAVALTGVAPLLERVATTLSEGERMLVSLTRLLAACPRAAIADEPVAALDPYHQLLILETLRELATDTRFCAAVVLHDLGLAARFCDRLVLLHQGEVAAAGAPLEVLSPAHLARCYHIRAEVRLDGAFPLVFPLDRVKP